MLHPALMWLKKLSRDKASPRSDECNAGSHNERDDAHWARRFWRGMRRPRRAGKKVFWIWIAYQSVKGVITLSLIWIPLFFLWLQGR